MQFVYPLQVIFAILNDFTVLLLNHSKDIPLQNDYFHVRVSAFRIKLSHVENLIIPVETEEFSVA